MSKRCIVLNCTNFSHEGDFVGELCAPCWAFVCDGLGVYSQAFRNAVDAVAVAALGCARENILLVEREPGLDIGEDAEP
jgi:hypothetical protein